MDRYKIFVWCSVVIILGILAANPIMNYDPVRHPKEVPIAPTKTEVIRDDDTLPPGFRFEWNPGRQKYRFCINELHYCSIFDFDSIKETIDHAWRWRKIQDEQKTDRWERIN